MANWKYQIDLSDIFSKLDDEGKHQAPNTAT